MDNKANYLEKDFLSAMEDGYETIVNPALRLAIKYLIENIQDELNTKKTISYECNAPNNTFNLIRLIKAFENELENEHHQILTPILSHLTLMPQWHKVGWWLDTKPSIRREWRLNKKKTISSHLNSQLDYEGFGNWFLDAHEHLPNTPKNKEVRNSLFCLGQLFCKININIFPQSDHPTVLFGWLSSEVFCELCSLAIPKPTTRFCKLHTGRSSDKLRREQKIKRLAYKIIPKNNQYASLLHSRKAIDVRRWREFVWLSLENRWRTISNIPRVRLTYDDMYAWRNFIEYMELNGGKANIAAVKHLRNKNLTFQEIGIILNCSRQATEQAFQKTSLTKPPQLLPYILNSIVAQKTGNHP